MPFRRNGNGLPIAFRDKSLAKSRQQKFFLIQRNADVAEQITERSNDFGAKKFYALRPAAMLISYGRVRPSKEKQAALALPTLRFTNLSPILLVSRPECAPAEISFLKLERLFSARCRLRGASNTCGQEPPFAQKRDGLLDRGGEPAP
jgi:hypothetical protein